MMDDGKQPPESDSDLKQPPDSEDLNDKVPPEESDKPAGGEDATNDDDEASASSSDAEVDEEVASSSAAATDKNCILFGRGKACNNNPANAKMREIIDRHRDAYHSAGRGEKKSIVLEAYKQVVEAGLKFMKQEKGIPGWIEADADEAIAKVGHAIRCKRTKGKGDEDSEDKPSAVARLPAAVDSSAASAPGQLSKDDLSRLSASLALDNALSTSSSSLLSTDALRNQQLLGLGIPAATSNPLLSSLGLTGGLHPSLPPSLLLSQPLLPPALSGLSAVDIHALVERERRLQQAMLYEHILRNPKPP